MSSRNAPETEGPLKAYDEMIDYFSSQTNFSVDELRKNKQIWDKLTNFSRGSVSKEPLKEEVYNEAANAAREQIHAAFPSTAKADRLFHVWNSLKESLYKADVANTGRQVGHLGDIPFAVVGGAAGSALGGPGGAAGGTIIGIALRELPQTVAWKTASVSARAAAIQALANQNVKLAIKALSAGASAKAQDELQAKFAP